MHHRGAPTIPVPVPVSISAVGRHCRLLELLASRDAVAVEACILQNARKPPPVQEANAAATATAAPTTAATAAATETAPETAAAIVARRRNGGLGGVQSAAIRGTDDAFPASWVEARSILELDIVFGHASTLHAMTERASSSPARFAHPVATTKIAY